MIVCIFFLETYDLIPTYSDRTADADVNERLIKAGSTTGI